MKAYPIHDGFTPDIRAADRKRGWMDDTPSKFVYHCLPLVIANEAGWTVNLPVEVTASWNGGIAIHDVTVSGGPHIASAHFGSGIVTFQVPCVFRTEPGVRLLVAGPANEPKDGICPLTGIVETDWAVATFTMNWKFTRPGTVVWAAGEPYCQVTPVHLPAPETLFIEPMPADLREQYDAFKDKRAGWTGGARDLDYRRGGSPGGWTAEAAGCEHLTNVKARVEP